MLKTRWIFLLLGIASCVQAQSAVPKATPPGVDIDTATACATNTLRLDLVADEFAKDEFQDQFVILVSRLGKNEISHNLHSRRLYTVATYLGNRTKNALKIVSAIGETADGLGRVEIYVKGKLSATLYTRLCEDTPVAICDDKDADPTYYLTGKLRRKCN